MTFFPRDTRTLQRDAALKFHRVIRSFDIPGRLPGPRRHFQRDFFPRFGHTRARAPYN